MISVGIWKKETWCLCNGRCIGVYSCGTFALPIRNVNTRMAHRIGEQAVNLFLIWNLQLHQVDFSLPISSCCPAPMICYYLNLLMSSAIHRLEIPHTYMHLSVYKHT